MKPRVMYIELKTGYTDNGPARIGRVTFSKTGRTIYYQGKSLRKLRSPGYYNANHVDIKTGEEYWISGVKKSRQDRHWAGKGPVEIDDDAREEYVELIGEKKSK